MSCSVWVIPIVICFLVNPANADEGDPWLMHPKQAANGVEYWSVSVDNDAGDILIAACAPSNKGVRVNVIPARPFIYSDKIVKARYRVDDQKSVSMNFHSVEERGTMVLFQSAERMLRDINKGSMHMEYQDGNVLAEFSLSGSHEALEFLGTMCPHIRLD